MNHQEVSFYIFIILIFLKYIRYKRIFILSLNQNAQRLGIDLESHFLTTFNPEKILLFAFLCLISSIQTSQQFVGFNSTLQQF